MSEERLEHSEQNAAPAQQEEQIPAMTQPVPPEAAESTPSEEAAPAAEAVEQPQTQASPASATAGEPETAPAAAEANADAAQKEAPGGEKKKSASTGTKKTSSTGTKKSSTGTKKTSSSTGTKKSSSTTGTKKSSGTGTKKAGTASSGKKSSGKKKKGKKKRKVTLQRSRAEIKSQTRKTLEAVAFMLPWLIGLLVFFAYPIITSLQLSFSRITRIMGFEMEFVGLRNYTGLFNNSEFTSAFMNALGQMIIFVPSVVIISMILAVLLNGKIVFRGLFRTMFFLPVLLGTGYILQQLLGMEVDQAAAQAGYEMMSSEMSRGITVPENLLAFIPPQFATVIELVFSQITQILWRSGVQILIFLSGLQSISTSVYESARVDGATEWEMFWKITIPSLAPVTVLTIIYTIVDSATDLTNPLINLIVNTTNGVTGTGENGVADYGGAAAMSWIYMAVVLAMVGIVLFATRKTNNGVEN